jgi:hypothetical protein
MKEIEYSWNWFKWNEKGKEWKECKFIPWENVNVEEWMCYVHSLRGGGGEGH